MVDYMAINVESLLIFLCYLCFPCYITSSEMQGILHADDNTSS